MRGLAGKALLDVAQVSCVLPAQKSETEQEQRKMSPELMAQKYSIPSLQSWKKFRLLREVVKTTERVEEELPQIRRPQVYKSWLALANDFLSSHFLPPKVVPTFHMPSHGFSADVAEHLLFSVALCPWIFAEQGKACRGSYTEGALIQLLRSSMIFPFLQFICWKDQK